MGFKLGLESREIESRSLTQQVAVSYKSGARQCWMIVWRMMSVEIVVSDDKTLRNLTYTVTD